MAVKKEVTKSVNFPTRQAAFDWLLSNGYKLGKSTFYGKVADGFPPQQKDGSIQIIDLQRFARTLDHSLTAQDSSLQTRREIADTEKAEHDCRIAKTKADNAEHKLSNEWAHREEVWSTVAAILGTLYTSVTHNAGAYHHGIIKAVNGDLSRGPQLAEKLTEFIDKSFNEISAVSKIDACFYRESETGTNEGDDAKEV